MVISRQCTIDRLGFYRYQVVDSVKVTMWQSGFQLYPFKPTENPLKGSVKRRHVIYIQGFFPKGASYYSKILESGLHRYAHLYGLSAHIDPVSPLQDDIYQRTHIKVEKEGEVVETTYDFLIWEDLIKRTYQKSFFEIVKSSVSCFWSHLKSGCYYRVARTYWKFLCVLLYPFLVIAGLSWLLISAFHNAIEPSILSFLFAFIKLGAVVWLGHLAIDAYALLLLHNYTYAAQYAEGRAPELDERIERFADHIRAVASTSQADEILVVGHSFGTALTVMAVDRALQKSPFDNSSKAFKLLTLGDICGHISFLEGSGSIKLRQSILRLARQPFVPWVVLKSGKDVISFNATDLPTACSALEENPPAALKSFFWPIMYEARFRTAMNEEDYKKFRWKFFHTHSQFIFAAKLKTAVFDYMRLTCGGEPLSIEGQRLNEGEEAWVR